MFDYEKIMSITPEQIIVISELAKLAQKAQKYEKLIKKTYLFTMGEDKIEIWSNSNNTLREYLTFRGTWEMFRRGNVVEDYSVDISAESIYKRLMARELRRSKVFATLNEEDRKTIEKHDRECSCMSRFLDEIEKLHQEEFKDC